MQILARLAALLFALLAAAPATAQQFPLSMPSQTVYGRLGVPGTNGPGQAIPFANFVQSVVSATTFTLGTTSISLGSTTTSVSGLTLNGGALVGTTLPNPTLSSLGGVEAINSVSHEWISSISTGGVPQLSQPGFPDLSGSASCSQLPALTGSITTSAGSCATSFSNLTGTIAGTPTFSGLQTYGGAQAIINTPQYTGTWHWGGDIAAQFAITTTGGSTAGGINAGSSTLPEFVAQFGMTSTVGSGNPTTAYKVAFSPWIIGTSTSADIYAMNPVCQGNSGFAGRLVCQENDINDNTGQTHEFTSIGTGNASYTYKAISGGSGDVSAAMWIFNGGTGKFANGIAITGALSTADTGNAAFQAIAGGYNFARALGSWTNGINMFSATITGGVGAAVLCPNNACLGGSNAANNAVISLIYPDPSNVVVVSDTTHDLRLNTGHIRTNAAATPTLTGTCGTGATVTSGSTDFSGAFTAGTGTTTTCNIHFAAAFINAPFCIVTPTNGGSIPTSAISTTDVAMSANVSASGKYTWNCIVQTGG